LRAAAESVLGAVTAQVRLPVRLPSVEGRVNITAAKDSGLGPAVDIGAYEYQGGANDVAVNDWITGCQAAK